MCLSYLPIGQKKNICYCFLISISLIISELNILLFVGHLHFSFSEISAHVLCLFPTYVIYKWSYKDINPLFSVYIANKFGNFLLFF